MNTPGFTAEATLYRTSGRYRASSANPGAPPSGEAVIPVGLTWTSKIGSGTSWTYGSGIAGKLESGIDVGTAFRTCDVAGKSCCGPDGAVKTRHCHNGLGCNIDTGLCEACGGPGQVCCDGDFTAFSLRAYTGILFDTAERIESCNPGARCDARLAPDGVRWIGSRRCQSCGTRFGGDCCAPDNRHALGRCFREANSGIRLVCDDPFAGAAGTCVACGRAYQPMCLNAGEAPCDEWLVARESDGRCIPCGLEGQPLCDRGKECRYDHWVAPNQSRTECVAVGGPHQPCRKGPGDPCLLFTTFCNQARICEPCGKPGEVCCPPGRWTGNKACEPGECREGRCFACGYLNMPVCQTGRPCHNDEPVNGWCRQCGKEGQVCCYSKNIFCDNGLRCDDSVCRRPGGGGGVGDSGWKTCSGQPYTWSTKTWPAALEDENGCIAHDGFVANSLDEALGCARAKHGAAAVIDTPLQEYTFAVTCPLGCYTRQYPARDYAQAKSCAEHEAGDCTVEDGPC